MRIAQWLVVLALMAPCVHGTTFDILVQDLVDNIECFDPDNCAPMDGVALVRPFDSDLQYELPIQAGGPGGQPPSYQFIIHNDGTYPYNGGWVDQVEVPWFGPGFRYTYSRIYGPFEFAYFAGPVPPPVAPNTIYPGSGCLCPPPVGWEWEECDEGPIPLVHDVLVPVGFVLELEGGTRVQAFPGARIRVEGAMVCRGTEEAGVVFEGNAWHGIEFAPGATGELSYTRITATDDSTDGGALGLEPGSEVSLDHCIIDHNASQGRGGGAFVADGAELRMRSCTVSHNSAANGGNLFVEGSGYATGLYNLVTFGAPQTMVTDSGAIYSNLQASCLYPLEDPAQGTGWYCNPGYADAANGDFSISFWDPAEPEERNCVIDVAVIEEDLDPDGTPTDMGALPFNQHDLLYPAQILEVADRPGDEGGMINLVLAASPNDGSVFHPVSFYAVWVRSPGTEELISSGQTIEALGLPEYSLQISTQWDSTASNGNRPDEYVYTFVVGTHSSNNELLVAFSEPVSGYSIDNLAPEELSGFGPAGDWVEDALAGTFTLDLEWDASTANDFDHYELFYTDPDTDLDVSMGSVVETRFSHTVACGGNLGVSFSYAIIARDHSGNESVISRCSSPPTPLVGIEDVLPLDFALEQNHPNPFNPTTTLRYDLARTVEVSLRVYNMQGRMVRELIRGVQHAGSYQLEFDAGNLASAVYFYRLQADDLILARRMVLLR